MNNEIIDRSLYISVLVGSFLGSWHCAAMCSPFALLARSKRAWTYHAGRGLSYITLGLIAGGLGEKLLFLQSSLFRWVGASLMLGLILFLFFSYSGYIKMNSFNIDSYIFRKIKIHKRSGIVLGFFSAALPCGWLWFNLTTAASSLDPLKGSLIMLIFWIGTIPSLVSVTEIIKKNILPQQVIQKKFTLWLLLVVTTASVILQLWMVEKGIHCKV